ncbi:BREX system P-loop protein BrxC [Lutibacter sp. HS1-25]|uniref:BREX system P-loop protein BrxC n=1 Tax=Lutibacter sp. HS1-25 TaxID=2485000 RepID=UPI0010106269|nr:BREX system P-loop protein BrxC [Lutibacter sp. HS1-25]RXP53134.1 BREX system P-loop protein BrxC [Lutibacter sp. HS1-25]
MMLLKEIYDRDIYREINPAVVVSNKNKETIEAEIKEYVFTDELIEKLFYIVDTVLNKRSGKSGIWINGYYGSGKSHFIKYVHYLLDAETSESAFEAFEKAVSKYDTMKAGSIDAITISNLKLLKKRVTAANCDNIMFNVEDETDDGSQERLTRIFLNMFNKFRGYNPNDIPLAILLEKQLDHKGQFEAFKKQIKEELGFNWETDAATVASFQLQDVLEIAKKLCPEFDIVSLHSKLSNPDNFKVGINATLIPELKSFLATKDKEYRLLFLVDEVSQYVGSNKEILLNFQNIIERVSDDCNNQVWIACTAQQTLDEVSLGADGVKDVQDEFGKILGRFDTRISLQSNDASYITQRRVLDKNSTGIEVLNKMYAEHKDYIQNQFKINHDLYKGYKSEEEFIIGYPFIPYQFKLIAHVFEAFQQLKFVIKQVKDNERSILGITHFTAKEHGEDVVGGFIPFDAFYNKQFNTNLTNRGAKAIENALELSYVKNNPFAERVVKVLFMISNLLENQRQTFPSNIENLGVLLMNTLDQNKMKLQKDIAEVLNKLVEESIIREEKGSYFFFNEDEMDVQNLIKSQTLILEDRLKAFDDFFRPLVKIGPKVTYGQNDFKMGYAIEAKEFLRNGDFSLTVLLTDNTPIPQKALDLNKKDLVICVNEWFNNDEALRKDFEWYCKTNKYFSDNSGDGTGNRSRTNENFKIRNTDLKEKIENVLKHKFLETRFISQNTIVESDQINGVLAPDRVKNLIDYHLSGIYKNHKLAAEYARTQQDLKKSAASNQVLFATLTPAEITVNDFITANNNQITVYDLINEFAKEPFGWRFEAVLDVLVHLVKKKKREFVYKGQQSYPIVDFINKAVSTSERMSCEVVTGEEIDQTILDNVVSAYKNIFNEALNPATDKNILFEDLIAALTKKLTTHQELEKNYYGKYPFGNCFQAATKVLTTWIQTRDLKKLFSNFIEEQEVSKILFDTTKGMDDFIQKAFAQINEIKSFVRENNENFKMLSPENLEKVKKINDFLILEDPRKEFRHSMKAYEEVKLALKEFVVELKKLVKETYENVYVDLEAEATKRKVSQDKYADKEYTLNGIDAITSLAVLRNKQLSATEFKSKELQKIIEATPKSEGAKVAESAPYYVSKGAATISNEAEMNAYLLKVREDMLALLKQNKTIILK